MDKLILRGEFLEECQECPDLDLIMAPRGLLADDPSFYTCSRHPICNRLVERQNEMFKAHLPMTGEIVLSQREAQAMREAVQGVTRELRGAGVTLGK